MPDSSNNLRDLGDRLCCIALIAAACVGFYVLAWAVWTLPRPM